MTDGLSRERQSFSYVAHELYLANIQLLGWAHSILNAESPEDGRAALLKTGDELSTWPRRAAKELLRLRARVEVLERERDETDKSRLYVGSTRRTIDAILCRIEAGENAAKVVADYEWEWDTPPDFAVVERLTAQLAAAREALEVVEAHHHFFDDVGSYHIEISHGGTVAFRELLSALAAGKDAKP